MIHYLANKLFLITCFFVSYITLFLMYSEDCYLFLFLFAIPDMYITKKHAGT